MLMRLRPFASKLLEYPARFLAFLPADLYTVVSLVPAILYLMACFRGNVFAGLVLLVLGSLLDAIDGAVARARGEAGPRGAFLDSVIDRVSDSMYVMGFLFLGYNPYLVYVVLVGFLLVSYTRARFEGLTGKSMEGLGIMERSDRIIFFTVVLLLHYLGYMNIANRLLFVAAILTWLTVLQRLIRGYTMLPRKL